MEQLLTPGATRPDSHSAPPAGAAAAAPPAGAQPRAPAASLDSPVQFLKGVGPKRAALLEKLGVRTVGDLVFYFPFRHERHVTTTIADLQPDTLSMVVARVTARRPRRYWKGPSVIATVADNTGRASVTWFNAPYVLDRVRPGAILRLTGRVRAYRGLPQFINPKLELLDDRAAPLREGQASALEPVYPATADLPSAAIARMVEAALDAALGHVPELYPVDYRAARKLPPRRTAIERMHRPTSVEDVETARQRLSYDELFALQIAAQVARRNRELASRARPLTCTPQIDARIRARLPFQLTAAQSRVIRQIVADMARDRPMRRLLQGDVGSGKTAVALYAALVAVANGTQAAILAPTELLAEQHHRNIGRLLAGSRVRHALWTGGASARRRDELCLAVEKGQIDLVVGTHAILESDVSFARLGLVVVDEQHRFGVRQRGRIRDKGDVPHYLVMSATPIPRTLAMILFGDLDVSVIDALPPGRSPVRTRIIGPGDVDHAWRFVRSRLDRGERAYVVYPLVEESDALPLRAATAEAERLSREALAGFRVELLHGRMKPAEKEAVMQRFAGGEAQVLVATTVVEVGIDVPEATVMVVQHADRYGLSQLHQLRGRVGRGGRPGFCYLMCDAEEPERAGRAASRLEVLTRTNDGFAVAEADLRQRGPGELLGTRQHGLPEFRVADLSRDRHLVARVRSDAAELLKIDPQLERPEWQALRREVVARFADRMGFLEIG